MEEEPTASLVSMFASVEDPRIERTKLHRLVDIILIAVCGVILPRICGGVKASSILLAKEEKDHGKSSEDVFG
jgi:hypothetical protein